MLVRDRRGFGLRALWAFVAMAVACALTLVPTAALAASLPTFAEDERVIIMDDKTGQVIFEQGADERAYPASTTKVLTALVAMDYVGDRLDEYAPVGDEVSLVPADGTVAWLRAGDAYQWRDLFYAMLLPSGNDAALTIAVNVARIETGNQQLGTEDALAEFARLMNAKAADLGCKNSHFVNPHGLYDAEHYTTARDMLTIASAAVANDTIREVSAASSYSATSKGGTQQTWYNSNWLVDQTAASVNDAGDLVGWGEKGVDNPYFRSTCTGVKTGYLGQAGRCLVFSGAEEDGSMSVLGVIFKASDRKTIFSQAGQVLDALPNYERRQVTDGKTSVGEVAVSNPSIISRLKGATTVSVVSKDPVTITADTTQGLGISIDWDARYVAPDGNPGGGAAGSAGAGSAGAGSAAAGNAAAGSAAAGSAAAGTYHLVTQVTAGTKIATLNVTCGDVVLGSYPLYAEITLVPFGNLDRMVIAVLAIVVLLIVVGLAVGLVRRGHRLAAADAQMSPAPAREPQAQPSPQHLQRAASHADEPDVPAQGKHLRH